MKETLRHADLDKVFQEYFAVREAPNVRVRANWAAKRLMDIVLACGLLALSLVLMVLAALATYLDTGRPILFTQVRRGMYGRKIKVRKFRTMVHGAENNLDRYITVDRNGRFLNIPSKSEAYTRVGRILELLWIVELPQLLSVIKGEMSIVGNRPLPDYVIDVLGTTPDVLARFGSPPGLTGYSQLRGREFISDEERIRLEKLYTEIYQHGDVFLEDLRIVLKTCVLYLGHFFLKYEYRGGQEFHSTETDQGRS